jgi:hypothetical protein
MSILLLPLKIIGYGAAGLALGAGWKIGTYLAESAIAREDEIKRRASELWDQFQEKSKEVRIKVQDGETCCCSKTGSDEKPVLS